MQQLRHHEHINKVIGTTPGGEYVWEYSTYGNITDYLQDPAKVVISIISLLILPNE